MTEYQRTYSPSRRRCCRHIVSIAQVQTLAVTEGRIPRDEFIVESLLAENAGAALQEIEQVSNQIASLVQNISASARSVPAKSPGSNSRTV